MRVASPSPDWQRTFSLIGDTHIGTDHSAAHTPIALAGVRQFTECRYNMQVGDVSESPGAGFSSDGDAHDAFLSLPGTVRHVNGNHDTRPQNANPANIRTGTEAALGLNINPGGARNWTLDTDFGVRIIGVSPEEPGSPLILDSIALDWLDTAAGETELPCIVISHAPLYNTVGAGNDTGGPDPMFISTEETMHMYPDDEIRALFDAHANIKAYLNGHTHDPIWANRFVTLENVGSRSIACINASATVYTGRTWDLLDVIYTFFVTYTATGDLEVRVRNHRANCWQAWPDGSRVKTVTPD